MTRKEYIQKQCDKDGFYQTSKGLAAGFLSICALTTFLLWVCTGFHDYTTKDIVVIVGCGMLGGVFTIVCDLIRNQKGEEYDDHQDHKKLMELRAKNNIR